MPVRSARILSCSASFERRRRTANRTRRRVARRPAAIAHRVPAATSSQRYEKVGRESKFICILPGASIRGVSQRRMSRRQKQARSHFVRRAYLRRCLNNGEIGNIGCSDEKTVSFCCVVEHGLSSFGKTGRRQPAAGGEYHRLRAESLKGIPPGKVCFRPFREFVCIGEDFTKCSEGVRHERPRSR